MAKVNNEGRGNDGNGEGGQIRRDKILKSRLGSLLRKPIATTYAVISYVFHHGAALGALLCHLVKDISCFSINSMGTTFPKF